MRIRPLLYATDPYEGFPPAGAQLDLQGWHSNDPVFAKLIAEVRPERIVEVGTWKGASAIGMAALAKRHGLRPEILCIDTWLGALEFWTAHDDPTRYGSLRLRNGYPGVYYTFLANVALSGHADTITPFPQTSLTGARWLNLQGLRADLIYIDGSHEESDVLADVAAFWPVLREGGVMFGDDFSPAWPSVRRAVRAFGRHHGIEVEEDNEFWIVRKTVGRRATAAVAPEPAPRPLLLVHAAEEARAEAAALVEQLGYGFVAPENLADVRRAGAAVWVEPGMRPAWLDEATARVAGVESLLWVEQTEAERAAPEAWCARWRASLELAGGAARAVALHPHLALARQRERCELLCRRCGVDLVALRLGDLGGPKQTAAPRPEPDEGGFAAQLETLNALGIGPHEFFAFPALQPIEVRPREFRVEQPEGGKFEAYGPTHFMLHPPSPGRGWTRLHLRGVEWTGSRFLSTTLALPSAQAPAVRFQWNIIGPDGRGVHRAETVLGALDVRNWVVPLPADVPAGSFAVLATRVENAATHAFAWATWRDPILFE